MERVEKAELGKALRSIEGSEVMRRLSEAVPLPSEGIVAGQAVASVVFGMLGLDLGAPINDVDVFVSTARAGGRGQAIAAKAQEQSLHGTRRRASELASHVTKAGAHKRSSMYASMYVATLKEGYRLSGTAREGLLNEVAYERIWGISGGEAEAVLRGFDMNCVQVGVDARTGRLAWLPGFEDFLAGKELKIVNVNTPFHTAARYFKKKAALGCFGDDELNMSICALPWARGLFDGPMKGRSSLESVAGRYGKKTHEDYAQQAAELSKWFREVKALDRASIWTMEPVFAGREDVLEKLKIAAGKDTGQALWRGDTEALLMANAGEFCAGLLRPGSNASEKRLARLEAMMAKSGANEDAMGLVMGLAQAKGRSFVGAQDISEQGARAIGKLLNEHPLFGDALSGMTLAEQARAAQRLKAAEALHGEKLYGMIESRLDSWRRQGGTEEMAEAMLDQAKLDAFIAEESLGGDRPLAKPAELEAMGSLAVSVAKSLLKVKFKELLTANELEQEGRAMRHCVGGYASAVEAGSSRIFKIEGAGEADRSTLELSMDGLEGSEHGARLRQVRSFANKDPGPAAQAASRMVAGSYGARDRKLELLAIAPALIDALDAGAVSAAKRGSAKVLLAAAGKEAWSAMPRKSELLDRIRSCMERHFEEPEAKVEKASRAAVEAMKRR